MPKPSSYAFGSGGTIVTPDGRTIQKPAYGPNAQGANVVPAAVAKPAVPAPVSQGGAQWIGNVPQKWQGQPKPSAVPAQATAPPPMWGFDANGKPLPQPLNKASAPQAQDMQWGFDANGNPAGPPQEDGPWGISQAQPPAQMPQGPQSIGSMMAGIAGPFSRIPANMVSSLDPRLTNWLT